MAIKAFVVFAIIMGIAEGKIFTRCELANAMIESGVSKTELSTWVCLAKHESNLDSEAISGGRENYGIFQIGRNYWCSGTDIPGKGCNLTCESLLSDNISNSISCAQKIYSSRGFGVWGSYKWFCSSGKTEHYLNGCNIE